MIFISTASSNTTYTTMVTACKYVILQLNVIADSKWSNLWIQTGIKSWKRLSYETLQFAILNINDEKKVWESQIN